jgi:hypothetical protein
MICKWIRQTEELEITKEYTLSSYTCCKMALPKSIGKELEKRPQKQQNLHLQNWSFLKWENRQLHRITDFAGTASGCYGFMMRHRQQDMRMLWSLWRNKESTMPLMALKVLYCSKRVKVQTITVIMGVIEPTKISGDFMTSKLHTALPYC